VGVGHQAIEFGPFLFGAADSDYLERRGWQFAGEYVDESRSSRVCCRGADLTFASAKT
jgi:hypothetical protein